MCIWLLCLTDTQPTRGAPDVKSSTGEQRTPLTRLGRAIHKTNPQSQPAPGSAGRKTNWLRDVILGGQDGLVNILGIILGVIAGGGSETVLITTGLAAAITESISMGAVAYTSQVSERDYYRAEQAREKREIETTPEEEEREVREIYASKGFAGQLLDDVVKTITANRDIWLETMMDEELHLEPVQTPAILKGAVVVTIATLIGHLIPLVPFFFLARVPALILAIVLSGLVLFGVGVYSAKTLIGDWRKNGVQMVLIGLGAAAIGFLAGRAPVQYHRRLTVMTTFVNAPCDCGQIAAPPAPARSSHRGTFVLAATILGSSMAFIDGTVATSLSRSSGSRASTQPVRKCSGLSNPTTFLGGPPAAGRFAGRSIRAATDLRNRRGTVHRRICSLRTRPNITFLILARALQGVGGALLTPASLAIISASFDENERGRAIRTWSGFTAITAAIGPALGGWLVEHVSWRAVFFLNVPIAIVVPHSHQRPR